MTALKKSSRYCAIVLLLFALSCSNNSEHASPPATPDNAGAMAVPVVISYDVIKEYPHDAGAFTEGLEYRDGYLYESTGEYGTSDIRKVELATGKVITSHKMDDKYFGEGLTILNNKLYQLTYKEGKGFVYDPQTLKLEQSFSFSAPEGWGMTNNGKELIFDDGTSTLHFLDPVTFRETRVLQVTDEHGPVAEINEPEMIKGFIYANQWKTDLILKIDTGSGRVVGRADLSTLRQRIGIPPMSGRRGSPELLNGIAYDGANNRIFVTGKNWPKLVEIKLDN